MDERQLKVLIPADLFDAVEAAWQQPNARADGPLFTEKRKFVIAALIAAVRAPANLENPIWQPVRSDIQLNDFIQNAIMALTSGDTEKALESLRLARRVIAEAMATRLHQGGAAARNDEARFRSGPAHWRG
jgi:ribosomal protein S20